MKPEVAHKFIWWG